jgi:type II secretory ATPase GspE/PulE/Tfp pilus assembly ATPase PilB-like protein
MEDVQDKTKEVPEKGSASLNTDEVEAANRMVDFFDENDIYGTAKFNKSRIERIVADLSGLDKIVYDYLTESNRITEQGLFQACMELASTNRDFTTLMLNHGAIKQDQLVELSLKVDPGELSGKELIEPSIPYRILREFKIMLHAITDAAVYLSTLSSATMAERALKNFFPRHKFYFVSAKVRRIISYLEKVEKYGKQQGTLLEVIVRKAIREKCSDIHIYPTRDGYNIKTRYLGQLYVERVGGMEEYHSLITKGKLESGLDPSNKRTPQDGQFEVDYNGRPVELRVATCPTVGNKETMVIRVLDPENSQVHFKELGITRVDDVINALRSPNGIFLICGVTGSGKTTTATSALRWILDRFSMAINTIEDPVENEVSDVKQTQIDPRSGVTFAKVLKSILRQDPDVVVLGEIRDDETAQIAFQAAETGHLLIGTLHVKDIRGVVDRLEYMGVDKEKILGQLRGVLVQKLIRTTCQTCHGEAGGCEDCGDKMYTSRTVVSEAVYLHDRAAVKKMMDHNNERWWQNIIEDAFNKYIEGKTDRREMIRSFGPDFEYHEEKEAKRYAALVVDGKFSVADFTKMFSKHEHLLTKFVN